MTKLDLQLYPADYTHPEWETLAEELAIDVHRNEGLARTNPARNLPKQDTGATNKGFFLQSQKDPAILAIASYGIRLSRGSTLIVTELFVPRSLRSQGYGRTALSLVEEKACKMHMQEIKLDALQEAVPFYRKYGYQAPERDYPSIVMTKQLS